MTNVLWYNLLSTLSYKLILEENWLRDFGKDVNTFFSWISPKISGKFLSDWQIICDPQQQQQQQQGLFEL